MTDRQTVSTDDYAKLKAENEMLIKCLKVSGGTVVRDDDGNISFLITDRGGGKRDLTLSKVSLVLTAMSTIALFSLIL